jgi:EmrB/QacA subfamily drug resistance transporter
VSARRAGILAALAATQLMGVINFSIVNVALPSIGREFTLRTDQLRWVVTAYVLMEGGFQLLGGRLCDVFDRKRVFLSALAVFGIGSLASGLAPSAIFEFLARGLQGLAGAVLAPASLALVATEFEEGEPRNRALGVFGTVASVGYIVGVVSGGLITGLAGWRGVFLVNIPLVAAVFIASALLLKTRSLPQAPPGLDARGAVAGTLAVVAVVGGLSQVATANGRWLAPLLIGAGAVAMLLFLRIERSARNPLVPFSILRAGQLSGALVVGGLAYVATFITAFTLTLLLQRGLSYSAEATGLILAPAGIGGIIGAGLAGIFARRAGLRIMIAVALAVMAAGTGVIVGPGIHAGVFWVTAGYTVAGIGLVGCLVTCTIAATSAVDVSRLGIAGGLLNTSQFVSGALGTALAGIVDADATIAAYGTSLVVAIGVIGFAAVISTLVFRPAAVAVGPSQKPTEEAVVDSAVGHPL